MNNEAAVFILASIAQQARLDVFRLLVQAGQQGLAAGAISEALHIPASTLSFHLKELSHAGLLKVRQEGRFMYYSANYSMMNQLITYLTENCCAGESVCCVGNIPCETKEAI